MTQYLGIDTGGTFTDFILYDMDNQSVSIHKVLSTPSAPEEAILKGIAELGVDTSKLNIIHGSTVATNAILEGKGVKTAYITNRGFADVLSIGRQAREELYNLTPVKKSPLIPSKLCLEVDSRLSAKAEHLQRMDDRGLQVLRQQLVSLVQQEKIRAVAINLLFSFLDDDEEKRIENMIKDQGLEDLFVSRSSDVLPEYKEYERGMTTALNACVGPLMQGYLQKLQQQLNAAQLNIMQSSGGTASVDYAGRYPVHLLLSGPAGGLIGAKFVASQAGFERLLSFDMGGTSTDVSIIDGDIGFTTEAQLGGYPVSVPMVDMHTIGAGGGSIATVDAGGMLLVGPKSAGADPGPACYGKGGEFATVTDANVVLGRLMPGEFLGGKMQLDVECAQQSIEHIASQLNLSNEQAAQGIIDVVNDHMVRALRVMSVQRGEDPEDYTLVSFGGAGGLHVCALADALEMKRALVPINAGVLSALGMVSAQPVRDHSRSINQLISSCNAEAVNHAFEELVHHSKEELLLSHNSDDKREHSGVSESSESIEIQLSVDVRYKGQSNALNISWENDLTRLQQLFHEAHENNYGHSMSIDVELVNLRVRLIGEAPLFKLPTWSNTKEQLLHKTRVAGFNKPVPVYQRALLQQGQAYSGPAVVVEVTSTTWVDKSWKVSVDSIGNLLLTKIA